MPFADYLDSSRSVPNSDSASAAVMDAQQPQMYRAHSFVMAVFGARVFYSRSRGPRIGCANLI